MHRCGTRKGNEGAPWRPVGHPRQRGAFTILSAVVIFLALAVAAVGLDTGRLWMERRHVQKLADMAALASARFTGCGSTLTDARDAALASIAANGGTNTDAWNPQGVTVTVERGKLTRNANKQFVFNAVTSNGDDTHATRVQVTKKVSPSVVLGGWFSDPIVIDAMATARGGPATTTFSLGASPIAIDALTKTFKQVWQQATGTPVLTDATTLQKLAASTISLEALMKAANVKTVDDLLKSSLTPQQLISAYSAAATTDGQDPAVVAALSQLAFAVGNNGTQIPLKEILSLNSGGGESMLDARINILGILNVSVGLLAPKNPLSQKHIFTLAPDVLGIAGLSIEVGDIPPIAIGPGGKSSSTGNPWCTEARSTDTSISIWLAPTENPLIEALRPFFLGLFDVTFDLRVKLNLGVAKVHVNYVNPQDGTASVGVGGVTSAASLTYTNKADNGGPGEITFRLPLLGKFGLEIGTNDSTAGEDTITDHKSIEVTTPIQMPEALPKSPDGQISSELAGTLTQALKTSVPNIRLKLGFISFNVGGLTSTLTNQLSILLAPALSTTVDPILRGLGIYVGAGDVTVYDIQSNVPELVM